MLTNFDIFAAAQGRMKCLVKEFTDVLLDGDCTLTFTTHQGQSLLSGIELVSTGLPLDPLRKMGQAHRGSTLVKIPHGQMISDRHKS